MENDRPWNDDLPNYQANPYYHSINDTIGTLNFSVVEKVTKTVVAAIAHLSQPVISGIKEFEENSVLRDFQISNYPNPFNQQTIIQLNLPVNSEITLNIFNIKGQKIATLSNTQSLKKGVYYFKWDAKNMASGTYILNVKSENNSENF
jgi:hypothetical protein